MCCTGDDDMFQVTGSSTVTCCTMQQPGWPSCFKWEKTVICLVLRQGSRSAVTLPQTYTTTITELPQLIIWDSLNTISTTREVSLQRVRSYGLYCHLIIQLWFRDSPTFPKNISPSFAGSACFLLGLSLDPEDAGDILLRNIGLFQNCMMLQSKKKTLFKSNALNLRYERFYLIDNSCNRKLKYTKM
jgi:hypothetical protein